jgi:hypothetical protein
MTSDFDLATIEVHTASVVTKGDSVSVGASGVE